MTAKTPATSAYNLTTEDVAAHYGLPVGSVRRLVRSGKLHAINIGTERRRILRFSLADLHRFELGRPASTWR